MIDPVNPGAARVLSHSGPPTPERLAEIEALRLLARRTLWIAAPVGILCAVAMLAWIASKGASAKDLLFIAGGVVTICGLGVLASCFATTSAYREAYDEARQALTAAFLEGLTPVDPPELSGATLQRTEFLPPEAYNIYPGPMLTGTRKGLATSITEAAVFRPASLTRSRGEGPVFQGTVIRLVRPKDLGGSLFLRPDRFDRTLEGIGPLFESLVHAVASPTGPEQVGHKHLVRFEDPPFERAFEVYATSVALAEQVLNRRPRALLTALAEACPQRVAVTLHEDEAFILLPGLHLVQPRTHAPYEQAVGESLPAWGELLAKLDRTLDWLAIAGPNQAPEA